MIKRANVNYCKHLFRKYAIYQLKPWVMNPDEWYDPSEEKGQGSGWWRRIPGDWQRSLRRPDSNGQSGGNSIPRMPKKRKPIPPEYQRMNRYNIY